MSASEILYDINKNILHQGDYDSFSECVEDAVSQGISITNANLRYAPLMNATLDGVDLSGADFTGANLTGANMSCIKARHAIFSATDLYNTCLAEAVLDSCYFINTNFGGTIVSNAKLKNCLFQGISCLDLDYTSMSYIHGCSYKKGTYDEEIIFSNVPFIIKTDERALFIHNAKNQLQIKELIEKYLCFQSSKIGVY